MWTDAARAIYRTDSRFYPSSMSDTEWKIIAPFLPSDNPPPIVDGLKRGHDRRWTMRSIVDSRRLHLPGLGVGPHEPHPAGVMSFVSRSKVAPPCHLFNRR